MDADRTWHDADDVEASLNRVERYLRPSAPDCGSPLHSAMWFSTSTTLEYALEYHASPEQWKRDMADRYIRRAAEDATRLEMAVCGGLTRSEAKAMQEGAL